LVDTATVKCKMKTTPRGMTGTAKSTTTTCARDMRLSPWHGLEGGREKQKARESKPTSSDREEQGQRNRLPNRGEPASRSHVERRAPPPNTGHTSLWHTNNNGNLIHRGPCTTCKDYAMHIYMYMLDQDDKFLNARDHRDLDISAGEVS
jgi:hypothetical protein